MVTVTDPINADTQDEVEVVVITEPGASVLINITDSAGGSQQLNVTANASGVASATTDVTSLADGDVVVTVDVFDDVGNPGPTTTVSTSKGRARRDEWEWECLCPNGSVAGVLADTVPPATPSVPVLDPTSDTGAAGDAITSDATPLFTGTAEPGSTVTLLVGDENSPVVVGSTVAANDGSYAVEASELADGITSVRAEATDAAGNPSGPSGSTSVTIGESVNTRWSGAAGRSGH